MTAVNDRVDYRVPCKNPSCRNKITLIKKPKNTDGFNRYCSTVCMAAWSPRMIEISESLGVSNQGTLLHVLELSISRYGARATSHVVGLSVATLRAWVVKIRGYLLTVGDKGTY